MSSLSSLSSLSPRSPRSPLHSPAPLPLRAEVPSAVHAALLVALDAILENGVPRVAVRRADCAVVARWERAFGEAADVVDALLARWARLEPGDPALTMLLSTAAAVAALADEAGLGASTEAGRAPELAALREAIAAASAHA